LAHGTFASAESGTADPSASSGFLSCFVVSIDLMLLSLLKAAYVALDWRSVVGNPEFTPNDKPKSGGVECCVSHSSPKQGLNGAPNVRCRCRGRVIALPTRARESAARDDKGEGGDPPRHGWRWMDRVEKTLIATSMAENIPGRSTGHRHFTAIALNRKAVRSLRQRDTIDT
jgi:hypothetical protein